MKIKLTLVLIASVFACNIFAQSKIPPLNQKIVDYVETVIGKKVDRGECWDLAAVPLYANNAKWSGEYEFGKLVDPQKNTIYPGDIIQFKNVKLKYEKDDMIFTQNLAHHTAIVYKVNGKGDYEIADQNNHFSGKKVGISTLRLEDVVQGKLKFYRPVPGE